MFCINLPTYGVLGKVIGGHKSVNDEANFFINSLIR